jgi:hypothetical protein
MDVSKIPPPQFPAGSANAAAAERGAGLPAKIPHTTEEPDVRPLDIPAALQILLTEVRAALELSPGTLANPDSRVLDPPQQALDAPQQAARGLVAMTLQSVPEDAHDAPAWIAAWVRADAALQAGIERALQAVTAWRQTPAAVIESVKDTRNLVASVLSEEPLNAVWLRPEWVDLAPKIERFVRRKRRARRRISDPDYAWLTLDDG